VSCPTCDHTLSGIGYGVFHCHRCGTLVNHPVDGCVYVPAVVQRCRKFRVSLRSMAKGSTVAHDLVSDWRQLGLDEATERPEGRPNA
jgi:tRNA(Ile2) C34 agmatinyltransferase TiaS